MSNPKFQSRIISRVKKASPNLKFAAQYYVAEDCATACMGGYDSRSFVYLLTSVFNEKETCIYVGSTKSQYSRFLAHIKETAFSCIYLFECEEKDLQDSEKLVIKEFKPLYNRRDNPLATRYKQIIGIDYTAKRTFEKIQNDLQLKEEYERVGLFGFALNPTLFSVLKSMAEENHCNCSEMLQLIFESLYPDEIAQQLRNHSEQAQTNLTTTIK